MKKKNKVRFVTKGRTLEKADSTLGITRISEPGDALNEHHDGPVNYEKMWKGLRIDAEIFWNHFLPNVQAGFCKPCQEHFTKVFTEANKKAGMGIREGGPAGRVPPENE